MSDLQERAKSLARHLRKYEYSFDGLTEKLFRAMDLAYNDGYRDGYEDGDAARYTEGLKDEPTQAG